MEGRGYLPRLPGAGLAATSTCRRVLSSVPPGTSNPIPLRMQRKVGIFLCKLIRESL